MKKLQFIVALFATLMLTGTFVSAFVLIGGGVKWQTTPREILVRDAGGHANVDDPDGGVTQVVNAIEAEWNNAGAGNLLTATLDPSPPLVIGDGISVMGFQVTGSGCTGSCLGVTLIPATGPGGETFNGVDFEYLNDADIFFNTSAKFYSDLEADGCRREFHIETVGVHEAGHLLGLDHTPVTDAVMYAFSSQCNPLNLHPDDVDGINCIYSNGAGCGACVPNGTYTVTSTTCSQPSRGRNKGDFLVETFIADSCGNPGGGVLTRIDVVDPALNNLFCEDSTGSNGRLGCAADNPASGLWSAEVTLTDGATPANCPGPDCECSIVIN
jgi:hypothetical protein